MESRQTGSAAAGARDGRIGWRDFALIACQLALLLVVMRQYQIENAGFRWLAQFAFAGFLVHALLPLRYRLPFFALLSLAGTAFLLGPANFAWLFGIGLVLIGICHLPLPLPARTVLLLLAGGTLAAQRAGVVFTPWSEAIWPVLGSMFMFRLIVYYYDLRHDKAPATPARSIAYFFMLPNASFPLFPVVDHSAFRRNYYDDDACRIYQTGVQWMLRGIVHLLLYRLVYYHLTLAPSEVTSPETFVQYVIASFLIYFKVSGLFHLIVGMLYLFGFRLPETHNRYFLSTGFTDVWRRINIYWKDFMQKVFYYPAVFRLKRLGPNTAIVVATIWVFFMTWFLHAYQWFWIRGTTLFVLQDMLFWLILGVLVVINSLYEMRYGRRRTLGKPRFSWRAVGTATLKGYLTFWLICVLWSFWGCENPGEWLSLWQTLGGGFTAGALLWPAVSLAVIFLGNIPLTKAETAADAVVSGGAWLRERATTAAAAVLLIGVSAEPVFSHFGPHASTIVHSLRYANLSRLDAAKLERGYYEGLTDVTRFNSQLWETYAKRPANWLQDQGAGLKRYVGGFVQVEMIPSFVFSTTYGSITTNRWGMRDQDYSELPGPGTFRAAILGASSVMGWGVGDDATFEAVLEQRLNKDLAGKPFARYELLNFGVQGYQPPQQLASFERALAFHPDAVIYVATGRELTRSAAYLAEIMRKKIDIPYPPLRDIVAEAGVTKGMPEAEAERRLKPHASEILSYIYRQIAESSRNRGIQPTWVFLPQLRAGPWSEETEETVRIAGEAGFVVIRLDDIFKTEDTAKIRLAEWDDHPSVHGHRLIADRLFDSMLERREQIFSSNAPAARTQRNSTTAPEGK